jgi:hypothetical protein
MRILRKQQTGSNELNINIQRSTHTKTFGFQFYAGPLLIGSTSNREEARDFLQCLREEVPDGSVYVTFGPHVNPNTQAFILGDVKPS